MNTYYIKAEFANAPDIRRCATAAERKAAEDAGYARITLVDLRRKVAWVNGENEAWGSGRPIGHINIAAIEGRSPDPMANAKYQWETA